jgi:hypothetical protein
MGQERICLLLSEFLVPEKLWNISNSVIIGLQSHMFCMIPNDLTDGVW